MHRLLYVDLGFGVICTDVVFETVDVDSVEVINHTNSNFCC